MCGRYSLSSKKEKLIRQFNVEVADDLVANYNIAPTQLAPVITNDHPVGLQFFRWGLIPYWSKAQKTGYNLINARKEGIESKPSFRIPFRKRRCLVIADSFYEWKKIDTKTKYPYRIMLKNGDLLAMAGVWDIWKDAETEQRIHSFSIITTPPNKEMEPVHNRMPAILHSKDDQQKWLEDGSIDDHLTILNPLGDGLLNLYRISKKVNSVRNNFPEIHDKVDDNLTLFD